MPSHAQYKLRRSLGLCVMCEVPVADREQARCGPCLSRYRLERSALRVKRKSLRRCSICGRDSKGRNRCGACGKKHSQTQKSRKDERKAAGLCPACGKPAAAGKIHCGDCLLRSHEFHKALRLEVIEQYGGQRCVCCGETTLQFLQIDHIAGNGTAHRKKIGQGGLYRWLKKNGFPSGFQILCANCNFAKGHYGVCPHQETAVPQCRSTS